MDIEWSDLAPTPIQHNSTQQLSGLQAQSVSHVHRRPIGQISGNLVSNLTDGSSSGVFTESIHVGPSDIHDLDTDDDDGDDAPKPKYGKKTRGRVKVKMEFIKNKLRRYTTFSKRKTGIMKKAYELSTLTGTQVMLLVASETGHVYTFATKKLQPMITSESGKALIQTCLNSPENGTITQHDLDNDRRMNPQGFEETELCYAVGEDEDDEGEAAGREAGDVLLNGELSDGDPLGSSFQPSQSNTSGMGSGLITSNIGNTFNINTIIPPSSNSDGTMSKATSLSLQVPHSTNIIHGNMEQLQPRPSIPQHIRYINTHTINNTHQDNTSNTNTNQLNSASFTIHQPIASTGGAVVGGYNDSYNSSTNTVSVGGVVSAVTDSANTTAVSAERQHLERRKDEQQQEITRLQNQLNQHQEQEAQIQSQLQLHQQLASINQQQLPTGHQLMTQQGNTAVTVTGAANQITANQLTANQQHIVIPAKSTLLQVPAAAQANTGLLPYQTNQQQNQTLVYATTPTTMATVPDGLALVNLLPAVSQPNNAYTTAQITGTFSGAQANPQQQFITIPISQLTNSSMFQLSGGGQPDTEKKS